MFRRYLVAGLLVWVPLGITVLVIKFLLDLMDRLLLLLPVEWRPETLLGFTIPGFGLILAIIILILTGVIGANLIGRSFLKGWESLLERIPLVRTVYSSVKQILSNILSTGSHSFRKRGSISLSTMVLGAERKSSLRGRACGSVCCWHSVMAVLAGLLVKLGQGFKPGKNLVSYCV
jgi:uncharacterized membrane protein